MFEVDRYLSKRFHVTAYNCWHFVRDVWFELTGDMLYDYTPSKTTRTNMWLAATDAQCYFQERKLNATEKACGTFIVLMQRAGDTPHIGVLYEGKVLHLRPEGVVYQPLDVASMGFSRIIFYTTKPKS
jgi:hypothetical protein